MNKILKTDLNWTFDLEKVIMNNFGTREENSSALLVVKNTNQEALCTGVIGGTIFKNMKFAIGYKEPGKHGWELRVCTQEYDLRVDGTRSLPMDSPEMLFVNEGPAGAELFALVHGNGFGDIHRFRFPARCGLQWFSVLDFYLQYFGLNLNLLIEKREGVNEDENK